MGLILMYIQSMIGYIIVALPFYVVGRIVLLKKRQKQIMIMNEILMLIFVLYLVGLASQTIIPRWNMGIVSDTGEFFFNVHLSNEISKVNLIPFYTLYQYIFETNTNVDDWNSVSLLNISANLLLFSPFGFFIPLIWEKWYSFKRVLFLGLTVTCFIEIIQMFIGRSTDIDDVILNTFGILIGYGVFLMLNLTIVKLIHKKTPQKQRVF
ncbi:VanZ family protein [Peribacillus huizhouensis]|uniref:Glycopeptide antibiotics resistance protein n=1 Tax=Peribacillus huizhouensis TaxID=1501239 RepID=A0ABR6CU64_9BACI|nr:VanZ family protein [Peribacillus huizhouensis]MBA9028582.1 glycopeptide antibiotics resistance protein [Peribacillus huizhouensis]